MPNISLVGATPPGERCENEGLGDDLVRKTGILHVIESVGINSRKVLIKPLCEGRELDSH